MNEFELIYFNILFKTTVGRLGAKCNIQLMSCCGILGEKKITIILVCLVCARE